jgi:hypothetical protein
LRQTAIEKHANHLEISKVGGKMQRLA